MIGFVINIKEHAHSFADYFNSQSCFLSCLLEIKVVSMDAECVAHAVFSGIRTVTSKTRDI